MTAMCFDLPVAVTDTVGCREDLVIEGQTGFIYPSDNPQALAKIIQRFANDPGLARQMGENARKHIASYSVNAAADGVVKGIEKAIEWQQRRDE